MLMSLPLIAARLAAKGDTGPRCPDCDGRVVTSAMVDELAESSVIHNPALLDCWLTPLDTDICQCTPDGQWLLLQRQFDRSCRLRRAVEGYAEARGLAPQAAIAATWQALDQLPPVGSPPVDATDTRWEEIRALVTAGRGEARRGGLEVDEVVIAALDSLAGAASPSMDGGIVG
ncbi:MAG TPA: hypothetical protein VKU87_00085 [Thermomicrobiaceae bacterium]|nr:hypothetical protein [Thermomicrobiaceae bacterium]